DLDDAEEAAQSHSRDMSGSLRVASLRGLPTQVASTAIAEFRTRHPKVTFNLLSDSLVARQLESHDLALLVDPVDLPGDAVVRPLLGEHSILCASPEYLKRHGVPCTPQDLRQHALVRLVVPGTTPLPLTLWDEGDPTRKEIAQFTPVLNSNDHEAALRCTLEG